MRTPGRDPAAQGNFFTFLEIAQYTRDIRMLRTYAGIYSYAFFLQRIELILPLLSDFV
jgi:hypothetical protein